MAFPDMILEYGREKPLFPEDADSEGDILEQVQKPPVLSRFISNTKSLASEVVQASRRNIKEFGYDLSALPGVLNRNKVGIFYFCLGSGIWTGGGWWLVDSWANGPHPTAQVSALARGTTTPVPTSPKVETTKVAAPTRTPIPPKKTPTPIVINIEPGTGLVTYGNK